MNELALFAGAGGGILGGHLLGWRTVCAVEWEPYPASVLVARQNDGLLAPFPIWDDVQTFDGRPWRGIVDVISGGFPCQDISAAGKGTGITGERSSMWKHMARIIGEVRPQYVFVENSPMLTIRGLGVVLGDLSEMGFNAEWGVISARDIGAPHLRERIWIVATNVGNTYLHGISSSNDQQVLQRKSNWKKKDFKQFEGSSSSDNPNVANARCELRSERDSGDLDTQEEIRTSSPILNQSGGQGCGKIEVSDTSSIRPRGQREHEQSINSTKSRKGQTIEPLYGRSPDFWAVEPNVGRVANGVADRVDRLKAIGNGQVPLCAATAWKLLTQGD